MRGLVQSKPFVRKSHRVSAPRSWFSFSSWNRRWRDNQTAFSSALKKWWLLFFISIVALFLWIFLLKWTWYNPTYLIQNIDYPESTRYEYWNTELFVLSSKFLRWKYYNALRVWWDWSLLDRVKKEYPFVKNAHIKFEGNQTVSVEFEYYEPDFVVKLWEKRYWVWWNNITAELDSNRHLWTTSFIVDTPSYLSWATSLSWFFYEVDFSWYKEYIPAILETFPEMDRFVYLAGSPNFIVFENWKMIFLYRDDVPHQLQKYNRLKKYYDAFDTLSTIDLWSLTQEKVVVWRW